MARGFQWFVAWRYLLARPRRVSTAVCAVASVFAIVAVCGTVLLLATESYMAEQMPELFGRPELRKMLDTVPVPESWRTTYPLALGVTELVLLALMIIGVQRSGGGFWKTTGLAGLCGLACLTIGISVYVSVANPSILQLWMACQWIGGVAGLLLELTILIGIIRYFFTFFTTVSMGGVAIGTMALVIVLSIMNGFETDLREKILGSNAHIRVSKADLEPDSDDAMAPTFTEYREVGRKLAGVEGVLGYAPFATSEVIIGANNSYSNVIIKGVDPYLLAQVTDITKNLEHDGGIERMWPLYDDGAVRGRPAAHDAGPSDSEAPLPLADAGIDPPPDDFSTVDDLEPLDFSEGEDPSAVSEQAARAAAERRMQAGSLDPPPEDFFVDSDPSELPHDFSGGSLDFDPVDPSGVAEAIGGMELGGPDSLDSDFFTGKNADDFWLAPDRKPGSPTDGFARVTSKPRNSSRINQLDGVLVGRELVKNLHLYVGQEVSLVSPLGQMTPAGPVPESKPYRVAGVFYTGMYEYDVKSIYVELASLQSFLHMDDTVDGIEVRIEDPDGTEPVKAAIQARLGPEYEVRDWKGLNRSLFSALKLEKIAMFLVLAIIILVASFSIVGNLIMVVVEKAREIALLKTLGASDTGIMSVFVTQGFFIGVVGTLFGVLNGLGLCWGLSTFGIPLDPDVYYIDQLPVDVDPMSVLAVIAASILISVTATIYPAWIGARVRPVDGLRYE